jgi:hypothetical protein
MSQELEHTDVTDPCKLVANFLQCLDNGDLDLVEAVAIQIVLQPHINICLTCQSEVYMSTSFRVCMKEELLKIPNLPPPRQKPD